MIETRGLRKSFTLPAGSREEDRRGRTRRRPRGRRGGDLRLPRPQRRRQDHHPADARHPASSPTAATPPSPAPTCCNDPGEVRRRIGYVAQGGSTWDDSTAREELVLQARLYGIGKADAQPAGRPGARGVPAHRVRRPQVQDLLRWPAPPGRHRARHHPRAEGRLPRRADHRPRPAEPRPHVGRDPPAARRGHDRLHHHALPRRGRRALRPDRDHGPRRDRRRGHAGRAEARDLRRRGPRRPRPRGRRRRPPSCSTPRRTSTSWRPSTTAGCASTSTRAPPRSR